MRDRSITFHSTLSLNMFRWNSIGRNFCFITSWFFIGIINNTNSYQCFTCFNGDISRYVGSTSNQSRIFDQTYRWSSNHHIQLIKTSINNISSTDIIDQWINTNSFSKISSFFYHSSSCSLFLWRRWHLNDVWNWVKHYEKCPNESHLKIFNSSLNNFLNVQPIFSLFVSLSLSISLSTHVFSVCRQWMDHYKNEWSFSNPISSQLIDYLMIMTQI